MTQLVTNFLENALSLWLSGITSQCGKAKKNPTIPLPRTKTTHKPVLSAQNPPFLRVGDQKKRQRKVVVGKGDTKRAGMIFQVSTKVKSATFCEWETKGDDGKSGKSVWVTFPWSRTLEGNVD